MSIKIRSTIVLFTSFVMLSAPAESASSSSLVDKILPLQAEAIVSARVIPDPLYLSEPITRLTLFRKKSEIIAELSTVAGPSVREFGEGGEAGSRASDEPESTMSLVETHRITAGACPAIRTLLQQLEDLRVPVYDDLLEPDGGIKIYFDGPIFTVTVEGPFIEARFSRLVGSHPLARWIKNAIQRIESCIVEAG